jgi:predicted dehydrogenase
MPKTLRAAVIGVGHMGRHHARIYSELPDVELVAIVDEDRNRAAEMVGKFGGTAYGNVAEILDQVDVASVAVPTVYHHTVAEPLIAARIGVLIEKPLAMNTQTARDIVRWARAAGCVVAVGHSERFNPVVLAMNRINVVPKFIETHRISPFTFRSADIGVVHDMMIHDIDIVLHLVRDREYRVSASGFPVLGPHEDVANARVLFSNGCVANLTASRLALKTERKIRVFEPDAYLSMDYGRKTGIVITKDSTWTCSSWPASATSKTFRRWPISISAAWSTSNRWKWTTPSSRCAPKSSPSCTRCAPIPHRRSPAKTVPPRSNWPSVSSNRWRAVRAIPSRPDAPMNGGAPGGLFSGRFQATHRGYTCAAGGLRIESARRAGYPERLCGEQRAGSTASAAARGSWGKSPFDSAGRARSIGSMLSHVHPRESRIRGFI